MMWPCTYGVGDVVCCAGGGVEAAAAMELLLLQYKSLGAQVVRHKSEAAVHGKLGVYHRG